MRAATGVTWMMLALAVASAPAGAQWGAAGASDGATSSADPPVLASPLLPPGHWALHAMQRADALGLLPGHVPTQRLLSQHAVGTALRRAAEGATDAGAARLARGWYARFLEEFPELRARLAAGDAAGSTARGGGAASLGYLDHAGRAAPGQGWWEGERTGALPRPDEQGLTASARVAAGVGPLVVQVVPAYGPGDELRLASGEVAGAWRSWRVSVGREPVGYGWARGGGLVLSGAETFDRVEIGTERAVRLPGWLRGLGPVSFHTFLARTPAARHPGNPYFWGARGAFQPHRRLTFSIHRAAIFGGDQPGREVTLENVARMLVGGIGGLAFENQIVSVEGRYRLPTERVIPLTVYAEWGAEDGAGAWWDVPGVVAGVMTPALPGLPEVELGAEFAGFAHSCCANPSWYRHGAFFGSWSGVREPLGHPLGGQGTELLLFSGASLLDGRLRLGGRAFLRDRKGENLFVPGRREESTGLSASVLWRASPAAEIDLDLAREAGDGWREERLRAAVRVFFGG